MNTVVSNTASGGHRGFGGGIMLYSSPATVISNTVEHNIASTANLGNGGGIMLEFSDATLTGNTVRENKAATADGGWGGGLSLVNSDAMPNGNTAYSNMASTASWGQGGGIYLLIFDNVAEGLGGGIYPAESDGTIVNNTIVQNAAATGGGLHAYCLPTQTITITNSIFWDDIGGELSGNGYTVRYSNIEGGAVGTGNIAADPKFVNAGADDFHPLMSAAHRRPAMKSPGYRAAGDQSPLLAAKTVFPLYCGVSPTRRAPFRSTGTSCPCGPLRLRLRPGKPR